MPKKRTRKVVEKRRDEAEARNQGWSGLSPQQQLADLDRRNLRALKQRARLKKKIEDAVAEANKPKDTKKKPKTDA